MSDNARGANPVHKSVCVGKPARYHILNTLLVSFTLLSINKSAKAGPHASCQNNTLNTYQHADCEHKFAQADMLELDNTMIDIERKGKILGLNNQFIEADKYFQKFVEADCILQGDATFGTMGTYIVEECRSTYFKSREKNMMLMLKDINDAIKLQNRNITP